LEDLLVSPRDLTYGIVQPGEAVPDGIPIVRVRDVRGGRVTAPDPLRVARSVEAAYERSRLRGGELLVTLVGTVGETAVAGPELAGWNVARAVAVVRVKPDVGARWVAWAMELSASAGLIAQRVNTTVQTTLNLADLRDVPIPLPPSGEREAIEAVLGALDEKIESNRIVMDTASALARLRCAEASWGRPLVPYTDRLVVRMGSAFKGSHFQEPGVGRPLLRIRDLKTFEPKTWTTETRADEVVIRPGDVVVGMDAEFRATLWLGLDAILNQRVCTFTGRPGVGRAFILHALEPELAQQEAAKTGTTVIHLNKGDIARFRVPDLSDAEHQALADATEPLVDMVVARASENRALIRLRDALLPELLSGRIRVAGAASTFRPHTRKEMEDA
jgi:type I restriction enzyme S subunit